MRRTKWTIRLNEMDQKHECGKEPCSCIRTEKYDAQEIKLDPCRIIMQRRGNLADYSEAAEQEQVGKN